MPLAIQPHTSCRDSQSRAGLQQALNIYNLWAACGIKTFFFPFRIARNSSVGGPEQDRDDLPVSTEVINSQDIEKRQIGDIRDVAAEFPNVSVARSAARFTIGSQSGRDQNAGFNIRGLDGNRVLMLVDGIRQPR
eukprot:gene50950-62313_t